VDRIVGFSLYLPEYSHRTGFARGWYWMKLVTDRSTTIMAVQILIDCLRRLFN
jgi:hypothetical protein